MVTLKQIIYTLQIGVLIIFKGYSQNYSQNYNKIKKSDTVYVLFRKELYKQIYLPQKMGYGDYYFYFDKYYEYKQINFYHSPKTPEERKEKKSFLRKHKDILINYNYLVNMYSYQNAKELLLNKKKIYLIDYKDIGSFSIKLIEVKVSDVNLNPIE